jgi:hypothetical protein
VKIPKTYVVTLVDKRLPVPVQEAFVAGTPDIKVVRLETAHSSFLVTPEKVVEIIVEAVGGDGILVSDGVMGWVGRKLGEGTACFR